MATHSLAGSQLESSCTTEEYMDGEGGSFPGLCKLACANKEWYTKTVHMHIMNSSVKGCNFGLYETSIISFI